jgi:hypothetical protein
LLEYGFYSAFNQGDIPLILPPPLMLQPIGPSTPTQSVTSFPMEPSSSSLPFDLDDIYEISPNLDDANSFMIPQVLSILPLRTSQQSTKGQYLSTKYQDVDFTQPKHNSSFAQALASHVDNPTSIVVALSTLDAGQWQVTLDAKYQSLNSSNTWRLKDLPPNQSIVTCKWLFKRKYHVDGTIAKYKVRFMPIRFSQVEGLDYSETFFSCGQDYFSLRSHCFNHHL